MYYNAHANNKVGTRNGKIKGHTITATTACTKKLNLEKLQEMR